MLLSLGKCLSIYHCALYRYIHSHTGSTDAQRDRETERQRDRERERERERRREEKRREERVHPSVKNSPFASFFNMVEPTNPVICLPGLIDTADWHYHWSARTEAQDQPSTSAGCRLSLFAAHWELRCILQLRFSTCPMTKESSRVESLLEVSMMGHKEAIPCCSPCPPGRSQML